MDALNGCSRFVPIDAVSEFVNIDLVSDLYPFRGKIVAVFSDTYFAETPRLSPNYRFEESPVGFVYIPSGLEPNSKIVHLASLVRMSVFGKDIVVNETTLQDHQLVIRDLNDDEHQGVQYAIKFSIARFYSKFDPDIKTKTDRILGLVQPIFSCSRSG